MFIFVWMLLALALSGWQVDDVSVIPLVPGASPRVFPSPDGQSVAFHRTVRLNGHQDYFVCLSDAVVVEELACYEAPQDLRRGFEPDPNSYFVPFSWSPDSSLIAAVGQPLVTLTDTDLWLLDTVGGEWTRLTDDGYEGPLTDAAPPAGVSVEVQPAWSPDGTQLAVERTLINDEGEFGQSTIALIDLATGDIRDLSLLPGHQTQAVDAGSITGMTWSPDGALLAVSLRHHELDVESDGVWLVNVESGALEQLVSVDEASRVLQSVYAEVRFDSVGPVSWSPDGSRLLFWSGNSNTTPVVTWPFWIDLENRVITPLFLPAHPNDSGSRRALRPLQAAWSPDGAALLVFVFGQHPDEPVTPLGPVEDRVRGSIRVVDVATGVDTMLGNLPLGPATALYVAAWGQEGDAIINGYHLVLKGP